jgi:serine phosphatase RsbU (regulator of sigma subunit)
LASDGRRRRLIRTGRGQDPDVPEQRPRRLRSDAAHNRERILEAAGEVLADDPRATLDTVARAANVSRGTLHRHFPQRADLLAQVNDKARAAAEHTAADQLRPPGELARATPTPLSIADILNKVPPHLLGDQVIAEAQRIPGVSSAAVYLVDLDGDQLRRLAGPAGYPASIPVPLAVGTEIPREGLPALHAALSERLPAAGIAPLSLRGRALGVLVAVGSDDEGLRDLAYEAAAAIALSDVYTDALDAARRTRATSPAAEIQQNLLPPRIVRTSGALIAGNVLPGHEIGGDWFDYAENPVGTWIGTADAIGTGSRAAALASVALGAFRSARHQHLALPETIELMDRTVREVAVEDATVAVTIGLWVPPTSTFSWVSCGELGPFVVDRSGESNLLEGRNLPPLGDPDGLGEVTVRSCRLEDGDRLVLASDGVLDRTVEDDEPFGLQGVVDAIRSAPFSSAAGAVSSVEATLRALNPEAFIDDATLIVLVPVLAPEA